MLVPTFAVVMTFVVFPVVWNFWLSLKPLTLGELRDVSVFQPDLSLENFCKVIGDPDFPVVLITTLIYAVSGSLLSVLMGLAAALLVNSEFPGRGLLRGLFTFPYIAPVVAVTFTWGFILDPQLGIVNRFATAAGWMDQPIAFLSERWYEIDFLGIHFRIPLALISVIVFEGWRYFPFAFLFILARLQAVPDELYQAASVDGAGPFQRFFHITLPQLSVVLSMLFLFRFIWTVNKFDDIFLLTRGHAGTEVLTLRIYDYAFGQGDIGAGSALALVLFATLGVFLIVYFRWVMKDIQ